jgi:antitoxin component of RelBE/YafQ-DinJ toxin-antitoxin module
MAENPDRDHLHLRVSPDLKRQVQDYAAQFGIPTNTAAILLITQALRTTERKEP